MKIDLRLPVWSTPVFELPKEERATDACQDIVKSLETQGEQTALAFPGNRASPSCRWAAEELFSHLGPCVEGDPGGQGHADQQSLHVLQVSNLALFPVPAKRFVVAKSGLNRIPAAIDLDQVPPGGPIADQTQRILMAPAPIDEDAGLTPAIFLDWGMHLTQVTTIYRMYP